MRNEIVTKQSMKNRSAFYHGTTDAFNIKKILLPPIHTNNLREDWRKKYHNMVFFTTSLISAQKFARKACEKYGGNPVVYEVRPIEQYFNTIHGEYITEKALVIGVVK